MLQVFHIPVDALQLRRNGDGLRAVAEAFTATDAVVRLAEGGDRPVVAYQVGVLEFAVLLLLLGLGVAPFRDGGVVMLEDARDVDAPGAGHAVFAVRAVP